jgi:hypothetical protein
MYKKLAATHDRHSRYGSTSFEDRLIAKLDRELEAKKSVSKKVVESRTVVTTNK